ncbi:MAG: hypothetical protein ACI35S_06795 [Anaeroplasma sp.]
MGLTIKKLTDCISYCAHKGYSVTIRDISFIILTKDIEEPKVAYKCLFGKDLDYNEEYCSQYMNTDAMQFLKNYIYQELYDNKKKKKKEDLSFEENKAEMIKLIKETQEAMKEGFIETKDALKIQADLRVKLNSQFNVTDESSQSNVIVNQKYDAICPYCGREVASMPMSKEDAILKYNLKDNNDD